MPHFTPTKLIHKSYKALFHFQKMLPRWHIVWGAVFTLILGLSANLRWEYLILIFASSVLIDFDHYLCGATRIKSWNLFHNFKYHKKLGQIQRAEREKGIRKRGDFHLFHTIEFHALIGIAGLFWIPFFYIFIGMIFHSMLDLFYLLHKDYVYRREYFFFNWVAKRFD